MNKKKQAWLSLPKEVQNKIRNFLLHDSRSGHVSELFDDVFGTDNIISGEYIPDMMSIPKDKILDLCFNIVLKQNNMSEFDKGIQYALNMLIGDMLQHNKVMDFAKNDHKIHSNNEDETIKIKLIKINGINFKIGDTIKFDESTYTAKEYPGIYEITDIEDDEETPGHYVVQLKDSNNTFIGYHQPELFVHYQKPKERWRAKNGEESYWCIEGNLEATSYTDNYCDFDNECYNNYNYFESKAEADAAISIIKETLQKIYNKSCEKSLY